MSSSGLGETTGLGLIDRVCGTRAAEKDAAGKRPERLAPARGIALAAVLGVLFWLAAFFLL